MANPIQAKIGVWNGNTGTAPNSFSVLPTAGNTVVVIVYFFNSGVANTVSSIVDNQGVGNVYTFIAGIGDAGAQTRVEFWQCASIGATSGTFTVTPTLSGTVNALTRLVEANGVILDQIGTATTASGATTLTVTASGANTAAADFVLTCIGLQYNGGTDPVLSHPATSAYTDYNYDTGFVTYVVSDASYKTVAATETSAASWTWTSATIATAAVIATFKPNLTNAATIAWVT
jgi:hypothetical protein